MILLHLVAVALADDGGAMAPGPAGEGTAPPVTAPSADDERLLAELLQLHGEKRLDAIAAMGESADPRAVPVLVDLVHDHVSGRIADAAVHALAHFPEGVTALKGWVLDRDLPRATRVAAAEALGEARSAPAADALVATSASRRVSGPVRVAVVSALAENYPDRTPARTVSDAGAVAWTMAGMGTGLGYGVATLGHFGRTQLEGLGGAAGAAGGATAGWFYARRSSIEPGDAAYVTLSEWSGAASGLLLTGGLTSARGPARADQVWLGGLVGTAAGAGIGLATSRVQRGTGRDAWGTLALTGAGVGTAVGGYLFVARGAGQGLATASGVATVGSFGLAAVVAPRVHLKGDDIGFVALGTAWGAVVGGFVPLPAYTARSGLPLATAGLAGIGAWGLSPLYDGPGDQLLGGWLGLVDGTVVGSGLEALARPGTRIGLGPVLGATGGAAVGIALAGADAQDVDGSDILWGGLATGWVAWQTLGWLAHEPTSNTAGVALTTNRRGRSGDGGGLPLGERALRRLAHDGLHRALGHLRGGHRRAAVRRRSARRRADRR